MLEIFNNDETQAISTYVQAQFEKHFPDAHFAIIHYSETIAVIVERDLLAPTLYSFNMGSDDDICYFHKCSNEAGPALIEFPVPLED